MLGAVLRIRTRIRIHRIHMNWAPWFRIRILLSLSKYSKKNLDFYCFVTSFDFLSLKNDVKVPSKSNMQENIFFKLVFCWHLEGQ
jgi:hypothetical protein